MNAYIQQPIYFCNLLKTHHCMHRTFLPVIIALTWFHSSAQDKFPLQLAGSFYSESLIYEQAWAENSDYYYFNNQGASLELGYTILSLGTKASKANNRTGDLKLLVKARACVYQIPNQSINTIIDGGLSLEKDFAFGLFLFGNAEFGLLRAKIYAPVYSVDEQGNLVEEKATSHQGITPVGLGLGWHFERQFGIPVGIRLQSFSFNKMYGQSDFRKRGLMIGINWRLNSIKPSTLLSI